MTVSGSARCCLAQAQVSANWVSGYGAFNELSLSALAVGGHDPVIGIDPTVPAAEAIHADQTSVPAGGINWEGLIAASGLLRWATMLAMRYPDDVPVLTFLASAKATAPDAALHESRLQNVRHHEIAVLPGGHYLHWTHAPAMASKIKAFLTANTPGMH